MWVESVVQVGDQPVGLGSLNRGRSMAATRSSRRRADVAPVCKRAHVREGDALQLGHRPGADHYRPLNASLSVTPTVRGSPGCPTNSPVLPGAADNRSK